MAHAAGQLHQLVSRNVKLLKYAWTQASKAINSYGAQTCQPAQAILQPVRVSIKASQPLHPRAFRQQVRSRWLSTSSRAVLDNLGVRQFSSLPHADRLPRGSTAPFKIPKTRVGDFLKQQTGRSPFSSTLRPNLTGGTLCRSSGGYSLGGGGIRGARYFSHTPTAPAQVMQNVSQGIRALLLNGKRAHFDGVDPVTGDKRWKMLSVVEDEVLSKKSLVPKASPGSSVEFSVNPTITAFSFPATSLPGFPAADGKADAHTMTTTTTTLATDGLVDALKTDFSRAVKEMAAILSDLDRLSTLGDLPISYQSSAIIVHFPGVDAETLERLCNELDVKRGIIRQDPEFDSFAGTDIALLFPFAPSNTISEVSFFDHTAPHKPVAMRRADPIEWQAMLSPSPSPSRPSSSVSDLGSAGTGDIPSQQHEQLPNPSLSPEHSGYGTIRSSELEAEHGGMHAHTPLEYQGIEGIYRFLEHCEPSASRYQYY